MNILITGANRGIGLALARQAAAGGAQVTGTYRSTLPEPIMGVDWAPLEVTEPAAQRALAERVQGLPQGHGLDLLVCNAGVYLDRAQSLSDGYAAALWAETMAVNVTGVFLTVQALLPALRRARGRIAILSSQMGSDARASGGSYVYRASKAAVLNLGRNLAVDLQAEGIAVGIYHPGWVQTEMGGPGAEITVEAAASGLLQRFAALSTATSGCFEAWDGRALAF